MKKFLLAWACITLVAGVLLSQEEEEQFYKANPQYNVVRQDSRARYYLERWKECIRKQSDVKKCDQEMKTMMDNLLFRKSINENKKILADELERLSRKQAKQIAKKAEHERRISSLKENIKKNNLSVRETQQDNRRQKEELQRLQQKKRELQKRINEKVTQKQVAQEKTRKDLKQQERDYLLRKLEMSKQAQQQKERLLAHKYELDMAKQEKNRQFGLELLKQLSGMESEERKLNEKILQMENEAKSLKEEQTRLEFSKRLHDQMEKQLLDLLVGVHRTLVEEEITDTECVQLQQQLQKCLKHGNTLKVRQWSTYNHIVQLFNAHCCVLYEMPPLAQHKQGATSFDDQHLTVVRKECKIIIREDQLFMEVDTFLPMEPVVYHPKLQTPQTHFSALNKRVYYRTNEHEIWRMCGVLTGEALQIYNLQLGPIGMEAVISLDQRQKLVEEYFKQHARISRTMCYDNLVAVRIYKKVMKEVKDQLQQAEIELMKISFNDFAYFLEVNCAKEDFLRVSSKFQVKCYFREKKNKLEASLDQDNWEVVSVNLEDKKAMFRLAYGEKLQKKVMHRRWGEWLPCPEKIQDFYWGVLKQQMHDESRVKKQSFADVLQAIRKNFKESRVKLQQSLNNLNKFSSDITLLKSQCNQLKNFINSLLLTAVKTPLTGLQVHLFNKLSQIFNNVCVLTYQIPETDYLEHPDNLNEEASESIKNYRSKLEVLKELQGQLQVQLNALENSNKSKMLSRLTQEKTSLLFNHKKLKASAQSKIIRLQKQLLSIGTMPEKKAMSAKQKQINKIREDLHNAQSQLSQKVQQIQKRIKELKDDAGDTNLKLEQAISTAKRKLHQLYAYRSVVTDKLKTEIKQKGLLSPAQLESKQLADMEVILESTSGQGQRLKAGMTGRVSVTLVEEFKRTGKQIMEKLQNGHMWEPEKNKQTWQPSKSYCDQIVDKLAQFPVDPKMYSPQDYKLFIELAILYHQICSSDEAAITVKNKRDQLFPKEKIARVALEKEIFYNEIEKEFQGQILQVQSERIPNVRIGEISVEMRNRMRELTTDMISLPTGRSQLSKLKCLKLADTLREFPTHPKQHSIDNYKLYLKLMRFYYKRCYSAFTQITIKQYCNSPQTPKQKISSLQQEIAEVKKKIKQLRIEQIREIQTQEREQQLLAQQFKISIAKISDLQEQKKVRRNQLERRMSQSRHNELLDSIFLEDMQQMEVELSNLEAELSQLELIEHSKEQIVQMDETELAELESTVRQKQTLLQVLEGELAASVKEASKTKSQEQVQKIEKAREKFTRRQRSNQQVRSYQSQMEEVSKNKRKYVGRLSLAHSLAMNKMKTSIIDSLRKAPANWVPTQEDCTDLASLLGRVPKGPEKQSEKEAKERIILLKYYYAYCVASYETMQFID